MKTVGALLTNEISRQLNDQRSGHAFTRWGRVLLLSYLNNARSEILAYRPDAFAQTVNIPLVTGRKQTAPDSYAVVRSVVANSDGTPVTEGDLDMIRAVGAFCAPAPVTFDARGNPEFVVRSFAIDTDSPKNFYVSPAVPAGLSVVVSAVVIPEIPEYTLADWNTELDVDQKYYSCLHDYIMGRANQLETESAEARANAATYMGNFYRAMGVKYKMESAYRSGYYLGKTGDGDPAARV